MSVRAGLPVLLALLASQSGSGALLASERPGHKPAAQLEAKLQQEQDSLKVQGYAPIENIAVESSGKTDARRFVLRLTQNSSYALIAGCGDDCKHVEIAIFDADGQQLSRSTKTSSIAIFAGAPDKTGLYEVEITQPGCRTATCPTGFVVMQQGGVVPTESVVVTVNRGRGSVEAEARVTSAPATGAAVSKKAAAKAAGSATTAAAAQPDEAAETKPIAASPPKATTYKSRDTALLPRQVNMERRFDTEIRGRNYRRFSNTSLTACERACVSDPRCRAVEFYPGNQSCGFFDQSPALAPARGIAASVKYIAVQ